MRCVFFATSSPKLYLLSRFCILLFFKEDNISIHLVLFRRKIHIYALWLFCMKFNFEQLLFKAFFDATHIFGSVEPQTGPTFLFSCIIILQKWESFQTRSSTLRGDRHTRSRTFCTKFNFEQLLSKAFFMRCVVRPSSPKLYLFSRFYTVLFFKEENLSTHVAPLWVGGGRDRHICLWTFCTKFNFEQLLFKAFFDAMRILAASSPKLNLLSHFCTL